LLGCQNGFRGYSDNAGSINRVTITATGLENDEAVIECEADGIVTGADVAALNAHAVDEGQSLSEIRLPPIEADADATRGHMGHDEFVVVDNGLMGRSPVCREGDTPSTSSGGTRQTQYKLIAGESG
jgi:hypothetical protein